MPANKSEATIWWRLLFFLALVKENVAVVKRDTTLDNVKAMYNRYVSPSTGKAKYLDGGKNACSMDVAPSIINNPGIIPVAASKDDFQSSLGCGACLKITGSGKPAAADLDGAPPVEGTLNGIVVDQDDSLNQGDLALLPPQSGSGLWEINFKAVDCPTGQGPTGFIQFRFTGSNEMYFKVQATNAKVPVAGIEALERTKGKWFCLTRTPDNFFTSEGMGAVSFPLKVRLTSIMNEQLEATVEALKNDVAIKSDIQFSDSGVRGGSPEGIQCFGQGERLSSGEGDEAFCVSKEDGVYADSTDQTAFYICKGEKATKKFCPTGLKFNPMISSCDVPEDVRFADNEADAAENFNSKGNTRWTSIPGHAGLKVLSVGGPEMSQKYENKTALQTQKPHKIFAINIFKAPNAIRKITSDKDRESAGLQNDTTAQTRLPKENSNLLDSTALVLGGDNQKDLKSSPNQTRSENMTISVREKPQLASIGNMESFINKPVDGDGITGISTPSSQARFETEAELKSKQKLVVPDSSVLWKSLAEISGNPAGKNRQSSPVPSGHVPHKLLAINVFGLHPKVSGNENRSYSFNDNNEVILKKAQDELKKYASAKEHGIVPFTTQQAPVQPLNELGRTDGAHSIPRMESNDYGSQQKKQNAAPETENKPFQDEIPTTNDGASSPLHFKLRVNNDQGGTQPIINCTLSECPAESDSAVLADKARGNGSSTGSNVEPNNKYDSQEQKSDNQFHLTLNTVGPEPLMGLHVIPVQGLQQLPFKEQKENNPPELEDTSHGHVQPPSLSLINETNKQLAQHNNDNTGTPLRGENSEERLAVEAQNNMYAMRNKKVDQELKQMNETKTIQHQDDPTSKRPTNNNFPQSSFTSLKPQGVYNKIPSDYSEPYNDRTVQNTHNMPFKESDTGQKELLDTAVRISPNRNALTNSSLEAVQTQADKVAQKNSQNDFALVDKSQPQLKIILKSPGKIGTILNSDAQLRRRSGARGQIVEILKSLIDRPLNLGASKKDVKARLYSLLKKSTGESAGDKPNQSDMASIKDSGSIAESILEANKEYLDDMAMQGMVFSDGDPQAENLKDIADTIKQSDSYLHKIAEFPQWENLKPPAAKSFSEFHNQNPDKEEINQELQNDEEPQSDDGEGSSSSGMGENNNTVSTHFDKHGKFAWEGPGGDAANQTDKHKDAVSVTVGRHNTTEVNAYKGGMLKSKVDPRLKFFCIGKASGTYTNPFDSKSFLTCSNGVLEERECPEPTLFNPKEKICDVPNDIQTERRKTG